MKCNANQAFNSQAPWVSSAPPLTELSAQAKITLFQLIVVVLVKALFCLSSIHSARRHFAHDPAMQQLVYRSLLRVLVLGDAAHLAATLYAMEPAMRLRFGSWSTLMWATVVADVSLFVSRALWLFGVGRDVITRYEVRGRERKPE
jgi:uncharacterized membrane protein